MRVFLAHCDRWGVDDEKDTEVRGKRLNDEIPYC